MIERNKIGVSKSFAGITVFLLLSIALLLVDSAGASKSEYQQEKQRVERALEELTQVINALEYSISVLYPLQNEHYVLPHTIDLKGATCNFGGVSQSGEDYDFLFSGPENMCDPNDELYQEAYRRLFIAPSMAYFAQAIERISSIYFLSKDKFIISSPKEFAQALQGDTFDNVVLNRPYWINTVRHSINDQHDKVVFTGDYEDYLTGEKVITVTRGIYIDGEFKGVLAIDSYRDSLLEDVDSGYYLASYPGENNQDLLGFTFSSPLMFQGEPTGLYLSVDEPESVHIWHILDYKREQLSLLLLVYLCFTGVLWFRHSERTKVKLQYLAMHDPLTSLANRRGFEHALLAMEEKRFLGIGVFDIDDFKQFNDLHGHEVGDQALRHIAVLMTDSTRQCDLVARFGGEEFVVAISGESDQLIATIFERIQQQISLQGYRLPSTGEDCSLTMSAGAVIYRSHCYESYRHLWITQGIRQADGLLYQAKAQGKNRVCIERK
ncbi:sensor domain-containing diguanylate cyclase [Vibrio sinaloensis]|uniref:sensor domain-containing diguanylate cyclase n=1 Tax=Photobacterium sp. (strain ATCC 43367) TaxID=379097 RepID=UPI0035E97370